MSVTRAPFFDAEPGTTGLLGRVLPTVRLCMFVISDGSTLRLKMCFRHPQAFVYVSGNLGEDIGCIGNR
jgi:hypothetical protein